MKEITTTIIFVFFIVAQGFSQQKSFQSQSVLELKFYMYHAPFDLDAALALEIEKYFTNRKGFGKCSVNTENDTIEMEIDKGVGAKEMDRFVHLIVSDMVHKKHERTENGHVD